MKVVLTEKPSVAREIAAVLGARTRREGYFEGEGYQITWAFGHLVTLKEPQDYDPALRRWTLETLPIIPESFELKQIGDKRAREQFRIISRLFKSADALICATDAGREGELIFRYILSLCGCGRKPVQRLWLSSLTPDAIRKAFRELKPLSEYDNLYAAARCRSESDWIVGLNATRHLTVRYGNDGLLWTVGRVQTPVLAMIVERDDAIRAFKSEPFWELKTKYRGVIFSYRGDRFRQVSDAEKLLAEVTGHPLVIGKVQTRQQRELPPLLYDLTELQREMNRRYGISAADTLKSAQSLYEAQYITYPRTDSRYLSSSMKSEVPEVLRKLQRIRGEAIQELDLDHLSFTRRIVDDSKVSDHHAIIPTGKIPRGLSGNDQKVFDAVTTRLIAVFYPPCLKAVTTVDGKANKVPFRARGVRVLDPGWTALYPRADSGDEEETEDEQGLPRFTQGESGPHEPFIKEGRTQPPKHFTENSLLAAMETAGKQVDDEVLKEALKDKGIGTPATRAAIIETLLSRRYLERRKKQLHATDLGRFLIALIQHPHLKSAELTGEWESKLRRVEQGKLAADAFMDEVVRFTRDVLRENSLSSVDPHRLGDCPLCGRSVIKGRRGYGCSGWNEGCPFVLWPEYEGTQLNEDQIRTLLQQRILLAPIQIPETGPSILYLSSQGVLMHIPVPRREQQVSSGRRTRRPAATRGRGVEKRRERQKTIKTGEDSLGNCPVCGQPVVELEKSFSCSNRRGGCKFVVWKVIAGKRLRTSTVKRLLAQGETSKLKGFKSRSGKPFEAQLILVNGQVKFQFPDNS